MPHFPDTNPSAISLEDKPWFKDRWWLSHTLLPILVFLPLAYLGEFSSLDRVINDLFYDFDQRTWLFGKSWWAERLIHKGGNLFVKVTAGLTFLVWLLGWWRPALKIHQRKAIYILLVIGLTTGLVALGKSLTNIHCPRELSHYGGIHAYIHLLDKRPDAPAGHCFPGGHSSGGFAFFFLYFLVQAKSIRVRLAALAFPLLLGGTFAFGQWVRGAHFFSHDLWSAFIAWWVALLLYRWLLKRS
ncbi:MAG: phosphatase PAP2 family protein [Magnetococcales bacterium]|nr:phosphatase PAP2 family protein [Magnetococcales bacterium]